MAVVPQLTGGGDQKRFCKRGHPLKYLVALFKAMNP
jgi:hypothetical protein